MYTQRIVHIPALGKAPELRAALEERNRTGNAEAPHALAQLMFSPSPSLIHGIRFESLADLEKYQNRPLSDEFRAQADRITKAMAQERITFLYEELVGTPLKAAPKFMIRNHYAPAAGKGPELRELLAERIQKAGTPGLAGAGLSRQVFPLNGPTIAVTLLFASMADIDAFRAARDADPGFAEFQGRVSSLSRAPMQQRVARVLAPFPA